MHVTWSHRSHDFRNHETCATIRSLFFLWSLLFSLTGPTPFSSNDVPARSLGTANRDHLTPFEGQSEAGVDHLRAWGCAAPANWARASWQPSSLALCSMSGGRL